MSGEHLLNVAVYLAQVFLLAAEVLLGLAHNQLDNNQGCRDNHHRRQGHGKADTKHHCQNADDCYHRCNHLSDACGEGLVYRLHIVYHPALNFPVGYPVKVLQREPVQLLGHSLS